MATRSKFKSSIDTLRNVASELKLVEGMIELLGWDQQVNMPSKGVDGRAKQSAFLSELYHKKLVSKELGIAIKNLESNKEKLELLDRALLRNISHDFKKAIKIPSELVREIAETASKGQSVWEKAKKDSNFKMFSPYLKKMVDLQIQVCEKVGYKKSPYDVLLDDYEEGMTEEKLDNLFPKLRDETIKLLDKIKKSKKKTKKVNLRVPIDKQKEMSKVVLDKIGYDFEAGRKDEAEHPFTVGVAPQDIRITTHYYEEDFTRALASTIHECGHALYEQGVDKKLLLTGLDEGISLGMHESQSRMWENVIGRSKNFWKYFIPRFKEIHPKFLKGVRINDFLLVLNEVKPSLIRIFADEVTYNLHIILRYEIEKGLIKKKIKVKDLPEIWNSKMKEYLDIKPKKDSEGVLQDVHWSSGYIGYFPTYTLGNMYAAQFWHALKKAVKNVDNRIAKGDLKCVLSWLRKEIHRFGHIYTADELCKKVTGKTLDASFLVKYLNEKCGKLYGITN